MMQAGAGAQCSDEEESVADGKELRIKRQEDFKWFVNASNEDITLMAKQMLIGIEGGSKELTESGLLKQNSQPLCEGLALGLKNAQKKMFSFDFKEVDNHQNEILNETTWSNGALILLNFIKENINYLQKSNFKQ